MRILFLTQWFDPEPGASRGLPLAQWLVDQGHSVEVLTGVPNYPGGRVYDGYKIRWRQREDLGGIPVLRVPLFPSHDSSVSGRVLNYGTFALAASTIGLASVRSADVAFVYHPPPTIALAASLLRRIRGIPFVYHISDMWPESVMETGVLRNGWVARATERAIRWWCNRAYREASEISVLSPGFKRLLVGRGVPEEKVHVIYNWTDEEIFKPVPVDPSLAEELGLANRFNVLYAGNLGVFQDLDTLVAAADLLSHEPAIQLVVAGTGTEELRLRGVVADRGLSNVLFLQRRQYWEMPAVNALADVMLVHLQDRPVFHSTIPGKAAVAMACGRPILMAVRGDAADMIEMAEAGRVIPPEDPAAMANAILALYKMDRSSREAMGARGREHYLEQMSLEIGARRTEELLFRAVKSKRIGFEGRRG